MDFDAAHLNYRLVDDPRTLSYVRRQLELRQEQGALERVAVDFEFAGLNERALSLRLLQLGLEPHGRFPEEQLLLDASKVDIRPFRSLFEDPSVEKLMHAPHSDYQRWFEYLGARTDADAERLRFQNVYDTAQHLGLVEAALRERGDERAALLQGWAGKEEIQVAPLGYSVSLATLSEGALGVKWSSKKAHWSDKWMAERLPEKQLKTAALDVAALPHLKALLAPFEAELRAGGAELDAEAQAIDCRIFEQARDLALVPISRREELRERITQLAKEAARSNGERVVTGLQPAEERVLVKDFSRPRARNFFGQTTAGELAAVDGRLVVRALSKERRIELSRLAEAIGTGRAEMPVLSPLEERMVTKIVARRYPDLGPELG